MGRISREANVVRKHIVYIKYIKLDTKIGRGGCGVIFAKECLILVGKGFERKRLSVKNVYKSKIKFFQASCR
jgi:hypothetical protein